MNHAGMVSPPVVTADGADYGVLEGWWVVVPMQGARVPTPTGGLGGGLT